MAITEAFAGTEAIGTTEWSLTRDASYSGATLEGSDGVFQVFLDLSDMVTGDILVFAIKEEINNTTNRTVYTTTLVGPQSPAIWVSPALVLTREWDATLDAQAGTITVTWSIRKVA